MIARNAAVALGILATACGSANRTDGGPTDAAGDTTAPSEDAATAPSDGGAATEGSWGSALESGVEASTVLDGPTQASADCANEPVPPSTLACTGLYTDIAAKTLSPGVQFYQPAVPLWADNAEKMRWIQLPPGTQVDATDPNEWTFPVGTKIWKEFSKDGQRVETRMFQKIDDGPPPFWVHATYAWNADESAAVASNGGNIPFGPDGGIYYIPTFAECEECHNGRTDHILGFEQVGLGLAGAKGLTLAELVKDGLIAPAPAETQLTIGDDGTGAAAPALAWLHINCGASCHNANPNASAYGAGMILRLDPTLLDGRNVSNFESATTTFGVPATAPGWVQPVQWTRIVPGDAADSLLVQLISNRGTNNPVGGQMPPIATLLVDTVDVANVAAWIDGEPRSVDGGTDGGSDATVGTSGDAQPDATTGNGGDEATLGDETTDD